MKKFCLLLIILLTIGVNSYGMDAYGDDVPPPRGLDVTWTKISLDYPLMLDRYSRLIPEQVEVIKNDVNNHIEDRDDITLSNYCYDPVVILYHGDDEYGFEIGDMRGMEPGYPIRFPTYTDIFFQGKFLTRDFWFYEVYFNSDILFTNRGIIYCIMEIELGNGKGQVPLIVVVDNTNPSILLNGRVR